MRVLVTGGSGFVGWRVVEFLAQVGHKVGYTYYSTPPTTTVCQVDRFQVNVRDSDQIDAVIAEFKPDVVVHAAALSDADECERKPSLAREVNVTGTRHVVKACERTDASIVFISSSFVFSGRSGPYVESDATNPLNVYGETKAKAETIVRNAASTSLVCRIDQPYDWLATWHEHTFIEWVLDQCNRGGNFLVFDDWYNTPVYLPDVAYLLNKLLSREVGGIYHLVGGDYVSRYAWACTAAEVFGYDSSIVGRGNSAEANLPARRPNVHLSNEKVIAEIGHSFHSLRDGLVAMREDCNWVN